MQWVAVHFALLSCVFIHSGRGGGGGGDGGFFFVGFSTGDRGVTTKELQKRLTRSAILVAMRGVSAPLFSIADATEDGADLVLALSV